MTRGIQLLVIAVLASAAVGCSSSTSSSTSTPDASGASGSCNMPVQDAGPGACVFGRAFVQCTLASGAGCMCITDGGACSLCSGATCTNSCAANEYAASCGGPPLPDGGSYQSPPAGCVAKGNTPGGNTYYCCPCR